MVSIKLPYENDHQRNKATLFVASAEDVVYYEPFVTPNLILHNPLLVIYMSSNSPRHGSILPPVSSGLSAPHILPCNGLSFAALHDSFSHFSAFSLYFANSALNMPSPCEYEECFTTI